MRHRCLKSLTDLRWRSSASFWLQQLGLRLAAFISRDHFLYAHSTLTTGISSCFSNHITQTCQLAGPHGDYKCGLLALIPLIFLINDHKCQLSSGGCQFQRMSLVNSRISSLSVQKHVLQLSWLSHHRPTSRILSGKSPKKWQRQKISPIRPVISVNRAFTNQVTCAETESFTVLKEISRMELLYKIQRNQPATFGRKRVLRLKQRWWIEISSTWAAAVLFGLQWRKLNSSHMIVTVGKLSAHLCTKMESASRHSGWCTGYAFLEQKAIFRFLPFWYSRVDSLRHEIANRFN